MAAVIRMKRHISDAPHSAFVLNCKKQKLDDSRQASVTSGETSTVLKFAGTVNQGEDISEHIAKITKEEAKDIVTKKSQQPESSLKSRLEQNREKSQQNRFKIVNCTRALNDTQEKSTSNPATKTLTIVDVEKESSTNSSTSEAVASSSIARVSSYSDIPDDEPFVYDIYIAETDSAVSYSDLNDLSILEYNDYLYSRPRLVNSDSDDEVDVEDEDSNDENNWRNDYPDEEVEISDNESVGERQMRLAMNNFEIGNELSSDEEENNGFVYSVDSEGITFEDDLDYCDVNRYGEAYARYKKRVLRELKESDDDTYEGDDDESIESAKDEDSFHSD